ncbi:MAG: hypothetical protein IJ756_02505 [Paludibacteraceae bacterium]|nr:hypothetical protein [Paludibacteraceae bacterium]
MLRKIKILIAKILTLISPTLNTQVWFKMRFGRFIDMHNPQTLNEKICWLKLNTYQNNPLVTQCCDKYAVREYVTAQGLGNTLNELLGVWERPEDIDFDKLPKQFVLKSNYFYGLYIICTDKTQLNRKQAVKQMRQWNKDTDHLVFSEMQYAKIPRKIICEKFITTDDQNAPTDYKVYCINGKAHYVQVCKGRTQKELPKFYFFDTEGNLIRNFTKDGLALSNNQQVWIPATEVWQQMILYAEKLCQPFPFVRVDFYIEQGNIIFGELTFTPAAGLNATSGKLPVADEQIGKLISNEELGIRN